MVFIDSFFLISLIHPQDDFHETALAVQNEFSDANMVTTESVLFEVFAKFARSSPEIRSTVVHVVNRIIDDANIEVVSQTRSDVKLAINMYGNRLDKSYSLTDYLSMIVMRRRGIKLGYVLTCAQIRLFSLVITVNSSESKLRHPFLPHVRTYSITAA